MAEGKSEREKEGKNKSLVSLEVQRSIISNHIDDFLNGLKQIKNKEEKIASKLGDIDKFSMELRFLRAFVLFGNLSMDDFHSRMSRKLDKSSDLVWSLFYQDEDNILAKYGIDHLPPRLLEDIKRYLSLKNDYAASVTTMTEEQLFEYLDSLLKNLHDLPKYCSKLLLSQISDFNILREVCGHLRDFNGLKIKGCIANETTEYLSPRFQITVDRVTKFCFDLWTNEKCNEKQGSDDDDDDDDYDDDDEEEDEDNYDEEEEDKDNDGDDDDDDDDDEDEEASSKISSLLLEIIPVELEVLYIYSIKLKESSSTELQGFVKEILEASPRILLNYLILLQRRIAYAVAVNYAPTQSINVMIEFLLIFLTDMPEHVIHRDKLNNMMEHVGVLARTISIMVSKQLEESSENNIDEADFSAPNLLQEIIKMKGDIRQIFVKAPESSQLRFPMEDGFLFLSLLLRHLNDLLSSNVYSVALIKEEIGMVKESLEFLRSSFGKVRQTLDDTRGVVVKDCWVRALDVAYEAEHVINSILVKYNSFSHLIFSLPSVIDKIKLIVEEVNSLQLENKNGDDAHDSESSNEPIESTSSSIVEVTVGHDEEETWIIDKLLDEQESDLDVISIVGMPGLGKTTLAKKVYKNPLFDSHFNVLAWCTVSQRYNKSKVLQEILHQVIGLEEKESEEDLAEKLRTALFDYRYLIVLDDVWDIATAEMLIACFPKVKRGNRIILTSRSSKVGWKVKCRSDPVYLQILEPETSWELFEKRVFGDQGSCPAELTDIGHKIVEKCQGLPLAIVLIAGVIRRGRGEAKKENDLWLKIQQNLDSFVSGDTQIMKVMQLSYDHLPDHLKPLLLYFGRYRKSKRTAVSKLMQLLNAEGFVDHNIPSKSSLEEAIQSYLNTLTSSSLIMESEMPGANSIKAYYVHDVVHDFCTVKAKKEKLFNLINSGARVRASDFIEYRCLTIRTEGQLQKDYGLFNSSKSSAGSYNHLISLKTNGTPDPSFVISQIRHLGLVRVLELGNITLGYSLMDEIGSLFHLRFLKIQTKVKALPRSWLNLQNLETLLMRSDDWIIILLPTLLKLSKLKHVNISKCCFFGSGPTLMLEGDNSKLTTLSRVRISCSKDPNDALEKFPDLQHFHCIVVEPSSPPTHDNWFPKFDVLTKLESLMLEYDDNALISGYYAKSTVEIPPPNEYHFPTNLKNLQLYYLPLTPALLSAIVALPKLEILEFEDCDFVEDKWDTSEDTYQSLKTLRLKCVQFSEWEIDSETFPKLEQLIIDQCNKLTEIPSAFGDIGTLKSIRVAHINRDLGNSAMEIKKDVETYTGEDRLDVHISDVYYRILEEEAAEEAEEKAEKEAEEKYEEENWTKKPQGRRPRTYNIQT